MQQQLSRNRTVTVGSNAVSGRLPSGVLEGGNYQTSVRMPVASFSTTSTSQTKKSISLPTITTSSEYMVSAGQGSSGQGSMNRLPSLTQGRSISMTGNMVSSRGTAPSQGLAAGSLTNLAQGRSISTYYNPEMSQAMKQRIASQLSSQGSQEVMQKIGRMLILLSGGRTATPVATSASGLARGDLPMRAVAYMEQQMREQTERLRARVASLSATSFLLPAARRDLAYAEDLLSVIQQGLATEAASIAVRNQALTRAEEFLKKDSMAARSVGDAVRAASTASKEANQRLDKERRLLDAALVTSGGNLTPEVRQQQGVTDAATVESQAKMDAWNATLVSQETALQALKISTNSVQSARASLARQQLTSDRSVQEAFDRRNEELLNQEIAKLDGEIASVRKTMESAGTSAEQYRALQIDEQALIQKQELIREGAATSTAISSLGTAFAMIERNATARKRDLQDASETQSKLEETEARLKTSYDAQMTTLHTQLQSVTQQRDALMAQQSATRNSPATTTPSQQIQREIDELNATVRQRDARIAQLEAAIALGTSNTSSTAASNASVVAAVEEQNRRLRAALTSAINSLGNILTQPAATATSAEQSVARVAQNLREAGMENLVEPLNRLREQIVNQSATKDQQIVALQQQLQVTRDSLTAASATATATSTSTQVTSLQGELASAQRERDELARQVRELQSAVATMERGEQDWVTDKAALDLRVRQAEAAVLAAQTASTSALSELRQQKALVEQQLAAARDEIQALKDGQATGASTAEQEVIRLTAELRSKERELQESRGETAALVDLLRANDAENKQLRERLERLHRQVSDIAIALRVTPQAQQSTESLLGVISTKTYEMSEETQRAVAQQRELLAQLTASEKQHRAQLIQMANDLKDRQSDNQLLAANVNALQGLSNVVDQAASHGPAQWSAAMNEFENGLQDVINQVSVGASSDVNTEELQDEIENLKLALAAEQRKKATTSTATAAVSTGAGLVNATKFQGSVLDTTALRKNVRTALNVTDTTLRGMSVVDVVTNLASAAVDAANAAAVAEDNANAAASSGGGVVNTIALRRTYPADLLAALQANGGKRPNQYPTTEEWIDRLSPTRAPGVFNDREYDYVRDPSTIPRGWSREQRISWANKLKFLDLSEQIPT